MRSTRKMTLEGLARWLLPPVAPGRALARREWVTLVGVADVLLEGAPHDVEPEQVADNVEQFLVAGRSRRAWRVRVLLTLIEVMPLSTDGRPWSSLSRARRRAIVETKWIGGRRLWRVCSKVRNLVVFGAYGDARAAAKTGYVPVPLRARFRHLHPAQTSEVA